MKVKVCGIRDKKNLAYLAGSKVDHVGFIFYQKSARDFESGDLNEWDLLAFTKSKVGVFVNATLERIADVGSRYQLDVIQLHGSETATFCKEVKALGFMVWKAISVLDRLPDHLSSYIGVVDQLLFDTKGKAHGGNGIPFDWSILSGYELDIPFMLSGGVGADDAQEVLKLKHPQLVGVDVNSRFEMAPGLKNEQLLEQFINELK